MLLPALDNRHAASGGPTSSHQEGSRDRHRLTAGCSLGSASRAAVALRAMARHGGGATVAALVSAAL